MAPYADVLREAYARVAQYILGQTVDRDVRSTVEGLAAPIDKLIEAYEWMGRNWGDRTDPRQEALTAMIAALSKQPEEEWAIVAATLTLITSNPKMLAFMRAKFSKGAPG